MIDKSPLTDDEICLDYLLEQSRRGTLLSVEKRELMRILHGEWLAAYERAEAKFWPT